MTEELTIREIFLQVHTRLGRVEEDVRGLRDEMNSRFDRVENRAGELQSGTNSRLGELQSETNSRLGELRAEMTAGFAELRSEMNARFGRQTALMVTVLLALVVGVGGLWLK